VKDFKQEFSEFRGEIKQELREIKDNMQSVSHPPLSK